MKREIGLTVVLSLLVAAVASVSWGSVSAGNWSAGSNWFVLGRYPRTVDRSFDLTRGTRLEVRSASFDVSFVRGTGTAVRIHGVIRGSSPAMVDGVRVTTQESDGRRIITIEAPHGGFGFMHFLDAHFTVEVPRVAQLAVVTTSGDVTVADQGAPLDVATSSGDVKVDHAGGAVTIRTSSGDVIIDQAAAAVQTHTTSGDVRVRNLGGSLSMTSTSGDLGATLAGNWAGSSLTMHSVSGDIVLTVPPAFHGILHTSTASGDVANDAKLPPTGSGGTPVELTSTSGDITVH